MPKPTLKDTNIYRIQQGANKVVTAMNEAYANINTAMSVLDIAPHIIDIINGNDELELMSPLAYLFTLLNLLDVTDEEIIDFISEVLVWTLPEVEIGIKAALIANLKSLISCSADPRIPKYMRRLVEGNYYTDLLCPDTSQDEKRRGLIINLDSIDPNGILNQSPFTEPGSSKYFGCFEEEKTTYLGLDVMAKRKIPVDMLVRAEDFNAFLWYVIHCGKHPSPFVAQYPSGDSSWSNIIINGKTYEIDHTTYKSFNLLGPLLLKSSGEEPTELAPGTTVVDQTKQQMSICVKREHDGTYYTYLLLPMSYNWFSCNWYANKNRYYKQNVGLKKEAKRDYSKDKGLCNLRYIENDEYRNNIEFEKLMTQNNLLFTILPKPYFPNQLKDTFIGAPIRLMFNDEGLADSNGRFSLPSEGRSIEYMSSVSDETFAKFNVEFGKAYLWINKKDGDYFLADSYNDNAQKISRDEITDVLVECYPGLTVYEFNYDFIMSMKLFDPKVVANNILNNAYNPAYGFNVRVDLTHSGDDAEYLGQRQRVLEIIRNILEEDDYEINDCFYIFSNEQYEAMQRMAEDIRYRQLPYYQQKINASSVDFTSVNNILNEYPENGTLVEQKEVIKHAFTQANAILAEYSDLSTDDVKINFVSNILEQLILAIIDAVISPKLLLALEVNRALMSTDENPITTEDLLRMMKPIIKKLIREIRDYIMRILLEYILKHLTQLALNVQAMVVKERYQAYISVLRQLLSTFRSGLFAVSGISSLLRRLLNKFKKKADVDLPTILDDITYADILEAIAEEEAPIINNC
jgi:hypothetical protein